MTTWTTGTTTTANWKNKSGPTYGSNPKYNGTVSYGRPDQAITWTNKIVPNNSWTNETDPGTIWTDN